jgi:hypothetical protein
MTEEQERARRDLGIVIKHIRYAAKLVDPGATAMLGVLCVGPTEHEGRVCATWDFATFIRDLELVLGAPPQMTADDEECEAIAFMQQFDA